MPDVQGATVNTEPGKCQKCGGSGRYKWEEAGQQRAGRCFSCNGTGRQSRAQITRNEIYNRWRDKVSTEGMDNLIAMRNRYVKELTKKKNAEFCDAFRVGWDLAIESARDASMLKGVKPEPQPVLKKKK